MRRLVSEYVVDWTEAACLEELFLLDLFWLSVCFLMWPFIYAVVFNFVL